MSTSSVHCSETSRLLHYPSEEGRGRGNNNEEIIKNGLNNNNNQNQKHKNLVIFSISIGCIFVALLLLWISSHSYDHFESPYLDLHDEKARIYLQEVEEGVFLRIDSTVEGNGAVIGTETMPWVSGSSLTVVVDKGMNCWRLRSTWSGTWLTAIAGSNVRAISKDYRDATCFEAFAMPQRDFSFGKDLKSDEHLLSFRVSKTSEWVSLSLVDSSRGSKSKFFAHTTSKKGKAAVFRLKFLDILKGVNLGGWFIPEVWMRPSFYRDTGLGWGGSLCAMTKFNESLAEERIKDSLATWVTENDFQQIHQLGFNSIRLPIGYWNVMIDPYNLFVPRNYKDSLHYIDWCFDMADKYNLTVLLDIHGAPGSQNGVDHSGCGMAPEWTSDKNIELTLKAIEKVAMRYSTRKNLLGFELLNEPSHDIEALNHDKLEGFYVAGYDIIRKYSSTCLVVFNELYSEYYDIWKNFAKEPAFYNVAVDYHLYNWQEPYTSEPPEMHIQDALDWSSDIKKYSADHPIIVGEWSMSTGTFVQAGQPFVDACLESFALTLGHYAWNWKIETNIGFDEWNVQYQAFNVEDGMRIL